MIGWLNNLRWLIWNPKTFTNGPGDWNFQILVNERKKAIVQKTRMITPNPDKIGTILILNNKKVNKLNKHLNDGYLNVDFFAYNDGFCGIIFRLINLIKI